MTSNNECPICLDEKELETLKCHHSLCLECVNSILDNQSHNKLSCPLCRTVSYKINNEDINTKIKIIESMRIESDNTNITSFISSSINPSSINNAHYSFEINYYIISIYITNYNRYCYCYCYCYYMLVRSRKNLTPIPKENPYQSHKIRNGNVVQLVYS